MHARMIVVAAHPDDETVGAASLLLRVRGAVVVHLTDGAPRDPSLRPEGPRDREAHARCRRDEALAALAEVRLGPAEVIALGAVDQEAAGAIAPLARDLAGLLRTLRPRFVVTHALEGGHPDHDAAAVVVRAAAALVLRRGGRPPPILEFASYHLEPRGVVHGEFLPGGPPAHERTLAGAALATKRRMISCYATQRAVLAPFRPEVERFRRAPPLSLHGRPHAPPLLYEAWGWSTFDVFRAQALAALEALGLVDALGCVREGTGFA